MSIPGRGNNVREGPEVGCTFKRVKKKNNKKQAGGRPSLGTCEGMRTRRSRALEHFAQVHPTGCLPMTVWP